MILDAAAATSLASLLSHVATLPYFEEANLSGSIVTIFFKKQGVGIATKACRISVSLVELQSEIAPGFRSRAAAAVRALQGV